MHLCSLQAFFKHVPIVYGHELHISGHVALKKLLHLCKKKMENVSVCTFFPIPLLRRKVQGSF